MGFFSAFQRNLEKFYKRRGDKIPLFFFFHFLQLDERKIFFEPKNHSLLEILGKNFFIPNSPNFRGILVFFFGRV